MADQGQCNGDLCSWFGWPPNQTKPNNAYLPLHDIPFWKRQTKDIAMVTSAADLGDLQTKPNNAEIYRDLQFISVEGTTRIYIQMPINYWEKLH